MRDEIAREASLNFVLVLLGTSIANMATKELLVSTEITRPSLDEAVFLDPLDGIKEDKN